jgi:hypothetical protein
MQCSSKRRQDQDDSNSLSEDEGFWKDGYTQREEECLSVCSYMSQREDHDTSKL